MKDDASRFRKNYEVIIPMQQRRPSGSNRQGRGNIVQFQERYTAQKGTARRTQEKSKKQKMKLRIASLILAAGIGLGGVTIAGHVNKEPEPTITEVQQMGVTAEELGLEQDTLETIKKYDEYFKNFDPKSANLTDNDVISMIEEIRLLNFNVIKDKVADLRGVERENVKLYYGFNKNDGSYSVSVKINEDSYNREVYTNSWHIFGLGKSRIIPKEIADLIVETGKYERMTDDLKSDHITKINAIKELEKLYRKISDIAIKDFTMDDRDNIELIDYTKVIEAQSAERENSIEER